MSIEKIKEKQHRLPKEFYKGNISVAFTLCIHDGRPAFDISGTIEVFTDILTSIVEKECCIVPVYCYMPDHQHLILTGISQESDLLKTIAAYKQKTGYWMSRNLPGIHWQKDFYDHIIRSNENLGTQVRYILDNPVRKGLVASWQEYSCKGSIGCNLEDVLLGIM